MQTYSSEMEPCAPFDFGKSLAFLGEFAPMRSEQQVEARRLTKAAMIVGRPVVFEVREAEGATLERPRLTYTLFSNEPLGPTEREAATDRIGFFLSLDDDLRPFYALASEDAPLRQVVERLYGYHQLKFLTPFEIGCWAVLTQRTPMPAAQRMKRALVARYGGRLAVGDAVYEAFPEPAALADVSPEDLTMLIHNERKAQYLNAVAQFFAGTDERWLHEGDYDEVTARLRTVNGIGAWSASFILVRGLGRMERTPVGEPELVRAVARVYGPEHATPEGIAKLAARYGRRQGYWAHYLRVGDLPIA
jgi:DNA-3-methyladenine glycosylase II